MTIYEKIRHFIEIGAKDFKSLDQKSKHELIICAMHDQENCDGWDFLIDHKHGAANFLDYLKWVVQKILTAEECLSKTLDDVCARKEDWFEKKFELERRTLNLEIFEANRWIKNTDLYSEERI